MTRMHYYVCLEGGIGDIINKHSDPDVGMTYIADAKRQGHAVSCIVGSFWAHSVKALMELNPTVDDFRLEPPWDEWRSGSGLGFTDWIESERQAALRGIPGARHIGEDRDRFVGAHASLYLHERDFGVLSRVHGSHLVLQTGTACTSTGSSKEWSLMNWEALFMILEEALPGHSFVLLGTIPTGIPVARFRRVLDWTGRTTLREAMAVLARADAMIGIDSFLRCAAFHTATPSVILYQPPQDDPVGHFRAYFHSADGPQNRILRAGRLTDISAAQVWGALQAVLPFASRARRNLTVIPDERRCEAPRPGSAG